MIFRSLVVDDGNGSRVELPTGRPAMLHIFRAGGGRADPWG